MSHKNSSKESPQFFLIFENSHKESEMEKKYIEKIFLSFFFEKIQKYLKGKGMIKVRYSDIKINF